MSSLIVTLVQSDLAWENRADNLRSFEEKIKNIKERTEVVILPEMFNTGFSMNPKKLAESMDGETVQWMKRLAKQKGVILTGSLIIEEAGNYFNRLVWMLPSGEFGVYDKRHRFGYAGEDQQFAPGNKRLIASVKGWRVNLQVCYDLRFPVWARQQVIAMNDLPGSSDEFEYDVLIYVANWPERRMHAWTTLLQARAIENQCYTIGVNRVGKDGNDIGYNGNSMIVDPLGEIIYQKPESEDVFTYALNKEKLHDVRSKFPFLKDADSFQILNDQLEKDKII